VSGFTKSTRLTEGTVSREGKKMKKLVLIVGILALLYLAFQSSGLQDHANRFVEQNQAHEEQKLQNFLSNK